MFINLEPRYLAHIKAMLIILELAISVLMTQFFGWVLWRQIRAKW